MRIKLLGLFLISFFLWASVAVGQTNYDAIGYLHKNFKAKVILDNLEHDSFFGVLIDTTFGTNLNKIQKVLDTGKIKTLRVHLLNNTAVRNGKLNKYELLDGYTLNRVNSEAKDYKSNLYKLIDSQLKRLATIKFSGTIYVSGLLEHNLDEASARKVYTYIEKKGFKAVDNPMSLGYAKIGRTERHGHLKSGLAIISPDGLDAFDVHFFGKNAFQKAADDVSYWIWEFNGRYSGLKDWIAPRARTKFATDADVKKLKLLMKPAGKVQFKTGFPVIKAPQILKPSAEDYKNGDPRAGLPCFITKEKVGSFDILNFKTEKKIGQLNYYGAFEGGGYRYYLGYPKKVDTHQSIIKKNNGSEWVLLKSAKYQYTINIVRRLGVKRP